MRGLSNSPHFAHGSWRNIYKQRYLIFDRIFSRVRNGASTSFWYDTWPSESSLASSFPRLHPISLRKTASVKETWNPNLCLWDMGFRRHLKDEEILDWASLSSNLEATQPCMGEDSWHWPLDSKGYFLHQITSRRHGTEELFPPPISGQSHLGR